MGWWERKGRAEGLLQVLPAGEVQPQELLLVPLQVGQQGVVGLLVLLEQGHPLPLDEAQQDLILKKGGPVRPTRLREVRDLTEPVSSTVVVATKYCGK